MILKKKLLKLDSFFIILGFFIVLSPRIVFELKHNFVMTKHIFYSSGGESSAKYLFPSIQTIIQRLDFFNSLFAQTVAGGNKLISIVLFVASLFILLRFYSRSSKIEKRILQTILTIFIVFFVGLTLFYHDLFDHYVVGIPLLFVLFVGMSVWFIKKNLSSF